jgi:hypothetical protein
MQKISTGSVAQRDLIPALKGQTVNSNSLFLTPLLYLPPCQMHRYKHPACGNTFCTLPPTDSDYLIQSRRIHAQPALRGNSVLQSTHGYIISTYHTTGQPTTGIPPTSIRHSIPYSASPPRPCRTRHSISSTNWTTTPAGHAGATDRRPYKHRQQSHTSIHSPQPLPTGTPHNANLVICNL